MIGQIFGYTRLKNFCILGSGFMYSDNTYHGVELPTFALKKVSVASSETWAPPNRLYAISKPKITIYVFTALRTANVMTKLPSVTP